MASRLQWHPSQGSPERGFYKIVLRVCAEWCLFSLVYLDIFHQAHNIPDWLWQLYDDRHRFYPMCVLIKGNQPYLLRPLPEPVMLQIIVHIYINVMRSTNVTYSSQHISYEANIGCWHVAICRCINSNCWCNSLIKLRRIKSIITAHCWSAVIDIHRWQINSPHKRHVMRKALPYHDVLAYDSPEICWHWSNFR